MQRFTISLDDQLALQFDAFTADKGYVNRSEAVRDLIRSELGSARLDVSNPGKSRATAVKWCVANVSYVYDRREPTVTGRVLSLQHNHHDLVMTSLHTLLDHDDCLETVVLRGPTAAVRACADQLIALRGVRHGNVHLVPLHGRGRHSHGDAPAHTHLGPIN